MLSPVHPAPKKAKRMLPDQLVPDFELKQALHPEQPDFEYFPSLMNSNEIQSIQAYASKSLGNDPSSKHFISRTKSIAFVLLDGDNIYPLERSYFIQNSSYNDFSGGLRRYYSTINDQLLQCSLKRSILHFAKYWRVPNRSIMLVQLQRSTIDPAEPNGHDAKKSYVEGQNDVTGQGIHTDGSDRAMILCCERDNVKGAENSFHGSLSGDSPLCEPRALAAGDALLFKDNAIFHHVSDAFPVDPSKGMHRTMLLIHYPGEIYLDGAANPANRLPTRPAAIVLRAQQQELEPALGGGLDAPRP